MICKCALDLCLVGYLKCFDSQCTSVIECSVKGCLLIS